MEENGKEDGMKAGMYYFHFKSNICQYIMRVIIILFLCNIVFIQHSCVYAEDLILQNREQILAFGEVLDWYQESLAIQEKIEDENSFYFLDEISEVLSEMRYFLMLSLEDEFTLNEELGDIYFQENKCSSNDGVNFCQTSNMSIMNSYVQCDTYWRTNYLSVIAYYYSDEGIYAGSQRVDAARRDDGQLLFYLNNFDPRSLVSCRCCVIYNPEGNSKSLYTCTLGSVLTVNLDVDRWQQGEEYEWGSELLYSKY